jgi:pimeloyl-ACP methyl ester carboxylesterase
MPKEIIHFSHANGFPALTYRAIFSLLEDQFIVRYIETLGHNPVYPVTDNWSLLVNELVDNLDEANLGKVIGIGHSLGGVLTLFAAIQRPDLFKAIILLDTPIFAPPKAKMIQWLKKIDKISWITPGGRRAKERRAHWSSFPEAVEYFRSRPVFKNFTEECLHDFITYGTKRDKDGMQLIFDPRIEAAIYHTMPHNYKDYQQKLKVPCVAIIGQDSDIFHQMDFKNMKKNFNIDFKKVRGGHLFPFEFPIDTVNTIQEAIQETLHTPDN